MKVSISKYLGFTDNEVKQIFSEEREQLFEKREEIVKNQKRQIVVVEH